jgi:ABC-type uncharacterized transport system auxiliary subunit
MLCGCNFSLEREGGEQYLMDVPSVTAAPRDKPARGTLTVYLPTVNAALDTRRVALQRPDAAFDYYADARWADFLPLLVRDAITQTLQHRRLTERTQSDDNLAVGPYRLMLTVEQFQAVYTDSAAPPVVYVHLQADLLDSRRPRSPHHFDIQTQAPATHDERRAILAAFHSAFEIAQRDLMERLSRVIQ